MLLESIWFFLWGFLWLMYFITDGFVLGVGAILPFTAKEDEHRRILLNTVGPIWDGNEVWLITAGAITFGAFPLVYAVLFTSLYSALMLLLFCLIVRGVSFEFRSSLGSPGWRKVWDICIFISSLSAAFLIGVAFANIFQGLPLNQEHVYQGSFFSLLDPYGLLGGLVFVVMFMQHGLSWLCAKTEGDLHLRLKTAALKIWPFSAGGILLLLLANAFYTDLYENYLENPFLFVIPLLAAIALFANRFFLTKEMYFKAWFASAGMIAGVALFGLTGIFPRILPSSINPDFSLTAYNSSAEPLSLKIMMIIFFIFVPLVLVYQGFAYHIFKHPVTASDIDSENAY